MIVTINLQDIEETISGRLQNIKWTSEIFTKLQVPPKESIN